jgi:hypothetical protein
MTQHQNQEKGTKRENSENSENSEGFRRTLKKHHRIYDEKIE